MHLSIIIPVYNVEPYIHRCLESVLSIPVDTHDYEVIVVNDGTKDNSMEVVEQIKTSNFVIINQNNKGLGAARNTGLNEAKGDWVFFLDSDDLIDSAAFASLLGKAKDSDADIVIGDYCPCHDDICEKGQYRIETDCDIYDDGISFFKRYYHNINTMVWRNLYRRDFLIKNSCLFTEGVCFEDVNWTPHCLLNATKVYYSPIPFYHYVIRSGSIMQSNISEKKIEDYIFVHNDLLVSSKKYDNEVQKQISYLTIVGLLVFNGQYSVYKNKRLYRKLKETVGLRRARNWGTSCIYWLWRLFPYLINPILHLRYGKVNDNRF